MSRPFKVPPVVFPSGGRPTVPRPPPPSAPPFRPAALPFMPFDVGAAPPPTSFSTPAFTSSTSLPVSSSASFDSEPPLLEELGIVPRQIWRKTISILNPLNPNPSLHEDTDLAGPFVFLFAFGLFQLLAGKLHFGIILGWALIAIIFLYTVFNMLAGRNGDLQLEQCASLVGYSMLPMVIFSAGSLFMPRGGVGVFVAAAVFVFWSTRACVRLLVELASCGEQHRGLVAYPCCLVYLLFSLLVIF